MAKIDFWQDILKIRKNSQTKAVESKFEMDLKRIIVAIFNEALSFEEKTIIIRYSEGKWSNNTTQMHVVVAGSKVFLFSSYGFEFFVKRFTQELMKYGIQFVEEEHNSVCKWGVIKIYLPTEQ